jgi:hypothetical protein
VFAAPAPETSLDRDQRKTRHQPRQDSGSSALRLEHEIVVAAPRAPIAVDRLNIRLQFHVVAGDLGRRIQNSPGRIRICCADEHLYTSNGIRVQPIRGDNVLICDERFDAGGLEDRAGEMRLVRLRKRPYDDE